MKNPMRVWDLDSTGQVTYWLAAMEKGLIVEMPEKVSMGKPTDPMGTALYIYCMKTAIKWSMVWYGIPNSCYIFCKHQILDIFGQTQMLSTALINALATVRPAQSRKTDWLGLLRCESCEPDFSQFGRARAWLARSFCTASHQWWQASPSLDCYASIAQTCEHWLAWWRKKNEVLVTVFNIDISSHIHFFGTQHPSDTFQIHFRHG